MGAAPGDHSQPGLPRPLRWDESGPGCGQAREEGAPRPRRCGRAGRAGCVLTSYSFAQGRTCVCLPGPSGCLLPVDPWHRPPGTATRQGVCQGRGQDPVWGSSSPALTEPVGCAEAFVPASEAEGPGGSLNLTGCADSQGVCPPLGAQFQICGSHCLPHVCGAGRGRGRLRGSGWLSVER